MIIDLILNRRSTVAFSSKPIEQEKIKDLFEAARLAPSSSNIQPWRFIYATQDDKEQFQLLFDCLAPGNQRWVKNAYMLVLSVTEESYKYKDVYQSNKYAWHDVGTSMGMLMVEAVYQGLVTHAMGGFNHEQARLKLDIPELFSPVAMIAVGYPGTTDGLSEDLIQREKSERKRKSFDEVVFRGKFKKIITT
jgi:nitroreductase